MRQSGRIITPKALVVAIRGSGGIVSKIAERLKVSQSRVYYYLRKKGKPWDYIRIVLENEVESVIDKAEETVQEMISQRVDLKLAGDMAKWYLSKRNRKQYGDKIEVDSKKSLVSTVTVLTSKELKALPIDMRKMLLKQVQGQVVEAEEEM